MPPVDAPDWPDFMLPIMKWMATNQINDTVAVVSILVTIGGFVVTILKLRKSQRAAEAAKDAAMRTQKNMEYVSAITDFAAAIEILDEIKRFHRNRVTQPLPDRYSALRKILNTARAGRGELGTGLTDAHKAIVQDALVNLAKAEEAVDRAVASNHAPDFVRLNRILTRDLDQLQEILVYLKSQAGGR